MLENDYEYLEVAGDRKAAASGTMGAAITYLVTAGISIGFWIRGCTLRSAAEAAHAAAHPAHDETSACLGDAGSRHSRYSDAGLTGGNVGL